MSRLPLYLNAQNVMYESWWDSIWVYQSAQCSENKNSCCSIQKESLLPNTRGGNTLSWAAHEVQTSRKDRIKVWGPVVWNHVFLRIHSCESGFESKPNQLTVGCMLWTRALAVLHGCACLWLTIKPNKSVSSVQNPRVKGEPREMLASLVGDWAFPTHTFYRNKLWASS